MIEIDEEVPIQLEEYVGVIITVEADGEHVLLRIDGFANVTVGEEEFRQDAQIEADLRPSSLVPDNEPPEAAFSWETDGGVPTVGEPIRFLDESDDDLFVSKWHWSFGDGVTSTERYPEHTYDQPGPYTVELTVSDAHGGSDTTNKTIDVRNPLPKIQITWDPGQPIEGDMVTLYAKVTDPDGGSIQAIDWELSDGSTYQGESIVKEFTDQGTYEVNVSAVDDEGDRGWQNETLHVTNAPPEPRFIVIPEEPTAGQPATLKSESFDPGQGQIVNTTWEISGIEDVFYDETVEVTFPRDGEVPVEITVTDDQGNSASELRKVAVQNPPPQVSITHTPTMPNPGQSVSFVAQVEDDDLPSAAEWTFPDGVTRTGMAVNHVFQAGGLQAVTVEVTDADGDTGEATTQVEVNHAPLLNLTASATTVETNQTVTLTAVASDPDGTIDTTLWSIDGIAVTNLTACDLVDVEAGVTEATCQWADDGDRTLSVTTFDDAGASTTNTTTVAVTNKPPSLDPQIQDGHVNEDETGIFQAQATDPDGPESALNITWRRGDDIVGFGQEIPLTFSSAQDVTLDVTAEDEDGGTASTELSFHVNGKPQASIDGPASVTAGQSASWTADASDGEGNPLSYEWRVDGTTIGTSRQLSHTFATGGTETLRVEVTDSLGASSTATLDVRVTSPPLEVNLTVDDETPLAGQEVTFSVDTNGRAIEGITWTFDPIGGDTLTETTGQGVDSLSHTFAQPRHVTVTAEVTADLGSSSQDAADLRVRGDQPFDIELEPLLPDQQCLDHTDGNVSVAMTNGATGETLSLSSSSTYAWTSENGCLLEGVYPSGTWSVGDTLGLQVEVGTAITSTSPGFSTSGSLDLVPLNLDGAELVFEDLALDDRTRDGILGLSDDDPGTTYHDPTEDVELSGTLAWITGQPAQGREISLTSTYEGVVLGATAQAYAEWTEQSDTLDGTFDSEVPKVLLEGREGLPSVEAAYLPGDYTVELRANGGAGAQGLASLTFTEDPEGFFWALGQPIP